MINVTDLSKYRFCPHSLYLEKIEKIRIAPTPEMIRGTIVHKIEETMAKKNDGILALVNGEMSEREISEILFHNWKRIIKSIVLRKKSELEEAGIDHIEFIRNLKHSFHNEAIIRGIRYKEILEAGRPSLYEVVVEEKIEDRLLGMRGIVDRIEIVEGHHIPVEIKTGFPSLNELNRLQISAYVMLCESRYQENIPIGFLYFTLLDDKVPLFITQEMKEKVLKTRDEVERILGGFVPDRIMEEKCKNCKYFNYCFN